MRYQIVPVKNVARLSEAADALINRDLGMPGMGLIHGPTGYGKTLAATWMVNQCHGVYVRMLASSTASSLLGTILRELDEQPKGSCAVMVERIVEKLAASRRPLFIDEFDHLIERRMLVETLRDLHDLATVPVILIGEEGVLGKLRAHKRLTRRLAEEVAFGPCDAADAALLATQLAEVDVGDDLVLALNEAAGGSVGLITVGLARIERYARARSLEMIDLPDWPAGKSFFTGGVPVAAPAKPRRGGAAVSPAVSLAASR